MAWIGKLISFLDEKIRGRMDSVIGGSLMAAIAITVPVVLVYVLQRASSISIILEVIVTAVILKMCFASRSMGDHIIPILKAMKENNIEEARRRLSMTVRRDTSVLDQGLIYSACIETISEGYVDGFLSPILYYGIFGLLGAVAARVINTLDSMVGYRNEKYRKFGKSSAVADTIMNFIPARASAVFFCLSSTPLRTSKILKSVRIESRLTSSRNAGWPMSAMAIILGVRVEKRDHYVLNTTGREPGAEDVMRSLRIFQISVLIGAVLSLILSIIIAHLILNYAGIFP